MLRRATLKEHYNPNHIIFRDIAGIFFAKVGVTSNQVCGRMPRGLFVQQQCSQSVRQLPHPGHPRGPAADALPTELKAVTERWTGLCRASSSGGDQVTADSAARVAALPAWPSRLQQRVPPAHLLSFGLLHLSPVTELLLPRAVQA